MTQMMDSFRAMLYGLAIAVHDYTLATALHFLCGCALVAALYSYTRKRSGWPAGILAACFFLMEDLVLFELRVAYVELAQALFFFLGFAVCLLGKLVTLD